MTTGVRKKLAEERVGRHGGEIGRMEREELRYM